MHFRFEDIIVLYNVMYILEIMSRYSEKATKFCEISTVDLTVTTQDKSMVEISQNFVAFSEYMDISRAHDNYAKCICVKKVWPAKMDGR